MESWLSLPACGSRFSNRAGSGGEKNGELLMETVNELPDSISSRPPLRVRGKVFFVIDISSGRRKVGEEPSLSPLEKFLISKLDRESAFLSLPESSKAQKECVCPPRVCFCSLCPRMSPSFPFPPLRRYKDRTRLKLNDKEEWNGEVRQGAGQGRERHQSEP